MSALRVRQCGCDPSVIPGVSGQTCSNCGAVRVVPMTREDTLRLREQVSTLRRAARMVELLEAEQEVSNARALELLGDAQILIGEAMRDLTASYESLQLLASREAAA